MVQDENNGVVGSRSCRALQGLDQREGFGVSKIGEKHGLLFVILGKLLWLLLEIRGIR